MVRRRGAPVRLLSLVALLVLVAHMAAQEGADSGMPGEDTPGFGGRDAFEAFAAAWPGRFSGLELVGEDWTIRLDGRRFVWAGGRLLPAPEGAGLLAAAVGAGIAANSPWSAHPFYSYPERLPPLAPLSPAERKRLEEAAAARDRNPPERNPAFFDQLWSAADEETAWELQKTILFFGHELLVHRDLLEELSLIEAEIRATALRDQAVATWVEGLGTVGGYLWRSIAGTRTRSFHAWGSAVDLVPGKAAAKSWYWLDARASGLAWYELAYDRRLAVPEAVVAAFERHGFVWGGKWRFWDQVHFEYRPEILVLNGRAPLVQAPAAAAAVMLSSGG